MTTLPRRLTIPLAISLALVMAPALAGCFNPGNIVENVVEQATGGDVDLGGASLPDGFPIDEVPVIEGEILYGGSIGSGEGTVWNVTVKVGSADALTEIGTQLTAAGFEQAAGGSSGSDGGTGIYSNDAYGVVVVVAQDGDDGFLANYTVTTAAATE